jgi:tetrapyrrole methylase family protein/MazG family protein
MKTKPAIIIVGLGPGDPAQLTREAWDGLTAAPEVYLRTARHPAVAGLPVGMKIISFDDVYERERDFEAVYAAIAAEVLRLGQRAEGVVYAVPGHPLVGEASVARILNDAKAAGLSVRLIAGLSFVEPVLAALGLDALDGLQIADAIEVGARVHPPLNPDAPALIAQLYNRALAADVKLTLMNTYPDAHEIALVHAAGTDDERVEWLPLYELDRRDTLGDLTVLYVPPLPIASSFENFLNTVVRLRAPDGCPWDREQTHQSLRPGLLEETYEVLAALDADDMGALREELGDLLLHVVMQSQMATEDGDFTMADVIAGVNAKLIRRHPHVFGGLEVSGVGEVLYNWEQIKRAEKEEGSSADDKAELALAGVPPALPALAQAQAYGRKAARVGFDWPEVSGVVAKVREEIGEIEAATTPEERAAELGDLLFAVVNWARWLDVDAETALREANVRFARRFAAVEAQARAQDADMQKMTIEELDTLWEAAKKDSSQQSDY